MDRKDEIGGNMGGGTKGIWRFCYPKLFSNGGPRYKGASHCFATCLIFRY